MIVLERLEPTQRVLPSLPVRPFSVAEYHKLLAVGILKSGDPYELLNGWIVPKMSINPPHNKSVRLLNRWFARVLSDDWVLQVQGAITLSMSEPEPDIAIVEGPEDRYDDVNPGGRDSHLIIEVADSSLSEDRGEKLQIYAQARIPIYWIVNLIDRQIEEYSQPRGGKKATYRQRVVFGERESIPVHLGGKRVALLRVCDMLP